MPGIEISKKNHEKLQAIRDEQGYRSFNEVLDHLLPDGTVSSIDYEKEPTAFPIFDKNDQPVYSISWQDLKESKVGDKWVSDYESAEVIYRKDDGCLVLFDIRGEIYLNYFHFI